MKYTEEFKNLIDDCLKNGQYVGLGCPNSKMLFVGKEARSEVGTKLVHGTAQSWQKGHDYSRRYSPQRELRDRRCTWQKYQKLYELIVGESSKKDYEITFVENVFTTELSNLHAPNTNAAKNIDGFKENLKKRKETFWQTDFIKNFPIIIITASDPKYIETYRGEVCELFDVKFQKQLVCEKGGKIWVHYAESESKYFPKLVIHTRQLTGGASTDLLGKIAKLVADFIKEHSIEIRVK